MRHLRRGLLAPKDLVASPRSPSEVRLSTSIHIGLNVQSQTRVDECIALIPPSDGGTCPDSRLFVQVTLARAQYLASAKPTAEVAGTLALFRDWNAIRRYRDGLIQR